MLFDEAFLRKLEKLRLAVRRAVSGRREGDRLTRKRGGAAEFTSHRSYAQGDDIRNGCNVDRPRNRVNPVNEIAIRYISVRKIADHHEYLAETQNESSTGCNWVGSGSTSA